MEMYHKVEKNGVSQILIDLTKFCNSDSSKEFPFPVKGTARISCNEIKNKYVLIIKQFRIDFIIILYLIIDNLNNSNLNFGNLRLKELIYSNFSTFMHWQYVRN